jgi:pimeloyl-ACP methyl ester carboxylesterase
MPEPRNTAEWQDIYYASFDDLKLHARHYRVEEPKGRPVLCLPGLTRNAKDFHYLALALASHKQWPREVYAIDYRGRGLSQYDRHWENYTPYIELLDTLDFMTLAGLHQAAIIGTSRGGIIAMMMAAIRPTNVAAVVLNDVGPIIETRGLARIMGYVGRMPVPRTWEDAGMLLRDMNERAFPGISLTQWEDIARDIFNERKGRPAQSYDKRLARAFGRIDLSRPAPDLWPQFAALAQFPVLVLRGGNSDLLKPETVDAMVERHPNLRQLTVERQGHAPLLRDRETVEVIANFLASNDPPA